jgi:FkbM family methyltransferase
MQPQSLRLKELAATAKHGAMMAGRLRLFNPLARAVAANLPFERREYLLSRLSCPGWTTLASPSGGHLKLWYDGNDFVTNEVVLKGIAGYEPDTLPVAMALAKRARTIFDLGASVGLYSLCMAQANPGARVFAFEPLDVVYAKLIRNVVANNLTGITCVGAAVGDTQGLVPLFAPAGQGLDVTASTVASHRLNWPETAYECSFVAQTRLDSFAEQAGIDDIDLIKIDVERAEFKVLEGMRGLLSKTPHIICEVLPGALGQNDHTSAISELVAAYGYRVYLLTPSGPVSRPHVEADQDHWEQLFTTMSPNDLGAALAG